MYYLPNFIVLYQVKGMTWKYLWSTNESFDKRVSKFSMDLRRRTQTLLKWNPKDSDVGDEHTNYWVSLLCSSSGILNTIKHSVSETGSVPVFR
jgi:hypothetical protein